MNDIFSILGQFKNGDMDAETTSEKISAILNREEEIDMFAKIDLSRSERCGFPEFIYGASKTPEEITSIICAMRKHGHPILATRVHPDAAQEIIDVAKIPDLKYEPRSKTLYIEQGIKPRKGKLCIVSAGTSDLPAALEAEITATLCGIDTNMITDCGVAGLHRLLNRLPQIREADVLIAVAGMEGALPSVLAGLLSIPIVALPTSVGYGVSFQGLTALLAMLNSCASGVTVVNIDNGFGAACAVARMLPLKN